MSTAEPSRAATFRKRSLIENTNCVLSQITIVGTPRRRLPLVSGHFSAGDSLNSLLFITLGKRPLDTCSRLIVRKFCGVALHVLVTPGPETSLTKKSKV